jgi:hypothetical protein
MEARSEAAWERLGLREWRCRLPEGEFADVGQLENLPGVREAWSTEGAVACALAEGASSSILPEPGQILRQCPEGRLHVVPVDYAAGPDLAEAAAVLGMDAGRFVELHSGQEYRCGCVGFAPGFAYLGPLPSPLDQLERRPSPRPSVEAGTVAVAVGRTAVYPGGTAGGWWLVGRTPLRVCDWRAGRFPIAVGDRVRFVPVTSAEAAALEGSGL